MDVVAVGLIVLWAVVLVQSMALVEVIRRVGQLRATQRRQGAMVIRDEGLPDGAVVPDLAGRPTAAGTAAVMGPGLWLVFFLTTECDTCRAVARGMRDVSIESDVSVRTLAVVSGDPEAVTAMGMELGVDGSMLIPDADASVALGFNIKSYPSVVVVDGHGRKRGHGIVNDISQAVGLLERSISQEAPPIDAAMSAVGAGS